MNQSDPTPGETGQVHATAYGQAGVANWNYVKLHHPAGMQRNDRIVLTLTFSRAVTNLTMTITDIDRDTGQWIDHVWVEPSGFSAVKKDSVYLLGSGTSASPWVAYIPPGGDDDGITTNRGDVTVTWPAPVTEVRVIYAAVDNTNDSGVGQHIGVGLFTVDNC